MGQNSDDDEETDPYFRTIAIVKKDNKDEFVRLINSVSPGDKLTIIMDICFYDAVKCLAAILDGVGGESLITLYLSDHEKNIPLHQIARRATPKIASLLLDKGFSADLRCDFDSPHVSLKNALPLNVALDYTRFYLHWHINHLLTPAHQIITLCRRMPQHHKTIRVIARNTKEIKHELFKYLKQGKVFEVGALLAIASDLIMSSSSTTDGENDSFGFKNITEMRQFLLQEMSRSLIGASNTQLMGIKKTLRLLEIFDRVGDKLVPHMSMWDDNTSDSGIKVASLIENASYDEEEEVEHDSDYDAVERYTPLPNNYIPSRDNYTTSPYSLGHRDYGTRSFSTQVHYPSWLEEESCHVDVSLPLPKTVKVAVTKRVLSKKHASFSGAFAKAIRHLRYR